MSPPLAMLPLTVLSQAWLRPALTAVVGDRNPVRLGRHGIR
jgi:hypothetical protein